MKMVNGKKSRMNEQKFYAVRQALELKKRPQDVAVFFDMHYSTVCRIRRFETWEAYHEYTREMAEASRKKEAEAKLLADAKMAELVAESAELEEDTDATAEVSTDESTIVIPSDELNQPATKQDLIEMEARLSNKIHQQIGGLRIYLSGPQKDRLVREVTDSVSKLFETVGSEA